MQAGRQLSKRTQEFWPEAEIPHGTSTFWQRSSDQTGLYILQGSEWMTAWMTIGCVEELEPGVTPSQQHRLAGKRAERGQGSTILEKTTMWTRKKPKIVHSPNSYLMNESYFLSRAGALCFFSCLRWSSREVPLASAVLRWLDLSRAIWNTQTSGCWQQYPSQ